MHDSPGLKYHVKMCTKKQADWRSENRKFWPKFSVEFEILDLEMKWALVETEQGELDQSVPFKLKVQFRKKI